MRRFRIVFLALFSALSVAEASFGLAVLVSHKLFDDGVQLRFLVLIRPRGRDVFVDAVSVGRGVFLGNPKNDMGVRESSFL